MAESLFWVALGFGAAYFILLASLYWKMEREDGRLRERMRQRPR